MLQLELEKENIYTKYQKYKAVAIEYKDRKEVQKSVLKNAYRFNEDVLAHCQSILKQEPRRWHFDELITYIAIEFKKVIY